MSVVALAPAVVVETDAEVVPEIGKIEDEEERGVSVAEPEVEAESCGNKSWPPPRATLLRVTRRGGARVKNEEGKEISKKKEEKR